MAKKKEVVVPEEIKLGGSMEEVLAMTGEEPAEPEVIPNMDSPEWTPFALSKLLPDESYEGCPKVDGLLRLVAVYVGDIIKMKAKTVQAPNSTNGNHSCVEYKIKIDCKDGKKRTYADVADVFEGNGNEGNFAWRYSSASCSTRALSRALRRALKLRNVVTFEEKSDIPEDETAKFGFITNAQINWFDTMCRRNKINTWLFLNSGDTKYASIGKIPYDDAREKVGELNKLQSKRDKIPDELKGFVEGWNVTHAV